MKTKTFKTLTEGNYMPATFSIGKPDMDIVKRDIIADFAYKVKMLVLENIYRLPYSLQFYDMFISRYYTPIRIFAGTVCNFDDTISIDDCVIKIEHEFLKHPELCNIKVRDLFDAGEFPFICISILKHPSKENYMITYQISR